MKRVKIGNIPISFNLISFSFILITILKFDNSAVLFSLYIAILFVYFFLNGGNKVRERIGHTIIHNKIVVFAYLISLLSTIVGVFVNRTATVNYLLEVVVFGLCTFTGISIYYFYSRDYIKKGMQHILFFLCINGVLGIFEYVTKINIFTSMELFSDEFRNTGRIVGMYIHPLIYGVMLFLGLVIAIILCKTSFLKTIMIMLLIVNLLLAQSRSSWFAAIALVFILIIRGVQHGTIKKKWIGQGLLILIAFVIFINIPQVKEVFVSRFSNFSFYLSGDYQRTGTIFYFLDNFLNQGIFGILFGNGNKSTISVMRQLTIMYSDFSTTDNLYISDLYNFGIIYVICIICTTIRILRYTLKENDKLALMFECVIIGFEIIFLFVEPFNYYPITFIFFLALGYLMGDFTERIRLTRSRK